jgi:putative lipoprotein
MPATALYALTLVLAIATLAACGRSEVPPEPPPAPQPPGVPEENGPQDIQDVIDDAPGIGTFRFEAYAYDCDGLKVAVRPGDGELTLILPDRSIVLPQVEARSGVKYATDDSGFWGRSTNSAELTLDGEDTPCELNRHETPWVDARERGARFRAVGQEPGWQLEIHPERMVMVYQYGDRRAVVPNPGVATDPDQPLRRWEATTEEHELSVTVEDRACSDVMSGEMFPAKVTVVLDGRNYTGCGRDLD